MLQVQGPAAQLGKRTVRTPRGAIHSGQSLVGIPSEQLILIESLILRSLVAYLLPTKKSPFRYSSRQALVV